MSTPQVSVDRRGGLLNVVDIVVAPNAAFERLQVVPTWGWAFLVASLAGIAGMLLMQPAFLHAFDTSGAAMYAANPALSGLSPEKQAQMIQRMMSLGRVMIQLQWLFIPVGVLFGGLISAVIFLFANAIGKGQGNFKRFFALAVTTSVVSVGIGLVLTGLICAFKGAGSFDSIASVQRAMPSLGMLAPGASGKLQTFLSTMTVTALWATALQAFGLIAIARIAPAIAWTFASLTLIVSACVAAAFSP